MVQRPVQRPWYAPVPVVVQGMVQRENRMQGMSIIVAESYATYEHNRMQALSIIVSSLQFMSIIVTQEWRASIQRIVCKN